MQSEKILPQEVWERNVALLEHNSQTLDETIDSLSKMVFDIAYGVRMTELIQLTGGNLNAQSIYEMQKMSTEMRHYASAIPCIKKFFLYLGRANKIIMPDGVYEPTDFYIAGIGDADREQWLQTLTGRYSCSFIKIGENDAKNYFAYSRSDVKECNITFLIEVDFDKILSPVFTGDNEMIQGIAVLDAKQRFVAYCGDDETETFLKKEELNVQNGGYIHKHWNGEDYMVFTRNAEQGNLSYVYITEENSFFNSVRRSRTVMLISNFVCIAFGLVLILVSVKRNYNPMNELLKLLDKEFENSETRENEFD